MDPVTVTAVVLGPPLLSEIVHRVVSFIMGEPQRQDAMRRDLSTLVERHRATSEAVDDIGRELRKHGKLLTDIKRTQSFHTRALREIIAQPAQEIEACYRTASLAFEAGDTAQALGMMRLGLGRDEFNATAWCLYGRLLLTSGNKDHAAEVFTRVIATFGLDCPALPEALVSAVRPYYRVEIESPHDGINNMLPSPGANWEHGRNSAVSMSGMATTYVRKDGNGGEKVAVLFAPWHRKGHELLRTGAVVAEWTPRNLAKLSHPASGRYFPVITHMTDKYLVLGNNGHNVVVDLADGSRKDVPRARVADNFGAPGLNCTPDGTHIAGVEVGYDPSIRGFCPRFTTFSPPTVQPGQLQRRIRELPEGIELVRQGAARAM